MEDERRIAKDDTVLKSLVSRFEFEGGVYSSDDELDLPFESNEISDDIDEMVCREQIRGAKEFFNDLAGSSSDDDDDEELRGLLTQVKPKEPEGDVILKPSVKYSDALVYFEVAMERNSKMRDLLLVLKQSLLKKRQEYEDMIFLLEEKDDLVATQDVEEQEEIITWGHPGYLHVTDGVVFTNKIGLFANQFFPPYFKDKKNFYCPQNKNALYIEKHFPISVSSLVPSKHWSPQSIENLENAIKKSLIQEFKNRADFKAIYKWREYSSFVKSHSLAEVMKAKPSDYKIDWLNIATLLPPEESRSSSECSKLWDLYLSPAICKDDWNEFEDSKIMELVKRYDEQDWDKISEELGTGRSPFQVFSYYDSNLRRILHLREKWTHEEDEFTKEIIASCTYGEYISWKKVMYYCEKKTYTQIYNRWQNALICAKKGKFSENEDRALISAFAHGMGYRDMSKAIGGQRSSQQIRGRLMAIVKFGRDDALNIGDWSSKEDKTLLHLVSLHGEKWSIIAKELGTRDRTQCRHRYRRLKKTLFDEQQIDVNVSNKLKRQLRFRRKRRGYSEKLRKKKQHLLKLLRIKSISQKKKKSFFNDLSHIMEDDASELPCVSDPQSSANSVKYANFFKYLINNGSGYWSGLDKVRTTAQEKQCIIDCCTVMGANLDYNLYDKNLECDEHLKPIKQLMPSFKDKKICESPSLETFSSDGASTSAESNCKNIMLIPPNSLTCYGFLQGLEYCSSKEKILLKPNVDPIEENDEIKKAKELFQQRLYQLFLWPAILCGRKKKNQFNTYGSCPTVVKQNPDPLPQNQDQN